MSEDKSGDHRVVPRALLENCLEVLEGAVEMYVIPQHFREQCTLAISQLRANLAIEKPALHAAKVAPEVMCCKICCAEEGQKHFLAWCRETGTVQIYDCRWRYSAENCPGHIASWHDEKICGNCGTHIDSLR